MTYEEKYKSKIKSVDEIIKILGPYPRDETVIMCHGTFDVVHPGHLRHLMYTKTKADVLLVSVTCDAHVTKADFRPFVPEGLRALNLAAFDMVDYVIIDDEPKPIKNIAKIQPDLFAKGYEYNGSGLNKKTGEEKKF